MLVLGGVAAGNDGPATSDIEGHLLDIRRPDAICIVHAESLVALAGYQRMVHAGGLGEQFHIAAGLNGNLNVIAVVRILAHFRKAEVALVQPVVSAAQAPVMVRVFLITQNEDAVFKRVRNFFHSGLVRLVGAGVSGGIAGYIDYDGNRTIRQSPFFAVFIINQCNNRGTCFSGGLKRMLHADILLIIINILNLTDGYSNSVTIIHLTDITNIERPTLQGIGLARSVMSCIFIDAIYLHSTLAEQVFDFVLGRLLWLVAAGLLPAAVTGKNNLRLLAGCNSPAFIFNIAQSNFHGRLVQIRIMFASAIQLIKLLCIQACLRDFKCCNSGVRLIPMNQITAVFEAHTILAQQAHRDRSVLIRKRAALNKDAIFKQRFYFLIGRGLRLLIAGLLPATVTGKNDLRLLAGCNSPAFILNITQSNFHGRLVQIRIMFASAIQLIKLLCIQACLRDFKCCNSGVRLIPMNQITAVFEAHTILAQQAHRNSSVLIRKRAALNKDVIFKQHFYFLIGGCSDGRRFRFSTLERDSNHRITLISAPGKRSALFIHVPIIRPP